MLGLGSVVGGDGCEDLMVTQMDKGENDTYES